MRTPHLSSGGRYPVLRAFAIIYLIMAVVALVSGIIGAGWALIAAPWDTGNRVVLALLTLSGSFFLAVGSLAVAELIKLFMDIEHNTRVGGARGASVDNAVTASNPDNGRGRFDDLEAETAEGALLRGH